MTSQRTASSIPIHIFAIFYFFWYPENGDITVICNTEYMELSIFLCPIYSTLYDETLMALNGEFNKSVCSGTPDWTVDPPVLRFKISINASDESFCGSQTEVLGQIPFMLVPQYSEQSFKKSSCETDVLEICVNQK